MEESLHKSPASLNATLDKNNLPPEGYQAYSEEPSKEFFKMLTMEDNSDLVHGIAHLKDHIYYLDH